MACESAAFERCAFTGSPLSPMPLKVGDAAPDFELPSHTGHRIKLSDFRGTKNVVLAFYVLANTPT
jgi:peroxiredoxin